MICILNGMQKKESDTFGERHPQAQHYPKVIWLASFFILKSKFIIGKGDFSGAVGVLESLIFKGWQCFCSTLKVRN